MVKKINSSKVTSKATATNEVARTVSTSEVNSVNQVKAAKNLRATSRINQPTHVMSAAERSRLMRIVREEATRLLQDDLPQEKKDTIEQAVQMTIGGAIIEDD